MRITLTMLGSQCPTLALEVITKLTQLLSKLYDVLYIGQFVPHELELKLFFELEDFATQSFIS